MISESLTSPAFVWMENQMNFILCWLIAFLPIVLFKIAYIRHKKIRKSKDSMVFTEAIGLPLTFLQPVVFFKSVFMLDWLGALITIWWGPGFLTVVFMVLWSKFRKKKINWGNSGVNISWLCKIYYLVLWQKSFSRS
jgi:F0F1-type ATP synthase assembly protein I